MAHPLGQRAAGAWEVFMAPETTFYGYVPVSGVHPRWPHKAEVMNHWLNVAEWEFTLSFSGMTQASSSVGLSAVVTVPTGALATLDEAGAPTLSSATPVDRALLYRSAQTTTVSWEVESGDEVVGDITYNWEASLSVTIHHGLWAWDGVAGKWLLGLSLQAREWGTNNVSNPGPIELTGESLSPVELDACAVGYDYLPGSEVQDGESGLWSYTCLWAEEPFAAEEEVLIEADAWGVNGSVGTLMGLAIPSRKTVDTIGEGFSLAPTLSVGIVPAAFYEGWF